MIKTSGASLTKLNKLSKDIEYELEESNEEVKKFFLYASELPNSILTDEDAIQYSDFLDELESHKEKINGLCSTIQEALGEEQSGSEKEEDVVLRLNVILGRLSLNYYCLDRLIIPLTDILDDWIANSTPEDFSEEEDLEVGEFFDSQEIEPGSDAAEEVKAVMDALAKIRSRRELSNFGTQLLNSFQLLPPNLLSQVRRLIRESDEMQGLMDDDFVTFDQTHFSKH